MKKRLRKKKAYKQYIQDIFLGYEKMLENPELKETTVLKRDDNQQIRFRTFDQD